MQPSGMTTWSGFRHPELSGMSASTSVRNTYSTAAMHTAEGALKLFGSCAAVPEKSSVALPKAAFLDHQEIVDQHAFLFDHFGPRRHGTGSNPANVGVVAARADVEQDLASPKDRGHDRHVG